MFASHPRPATTTVAGRAVGARGVRAALAGGLVLIAVAGGLDAATPAGATAVEPVTVITTDTGQLEASFEQQVIWAQVTVRASAAPDAAVLFQTDDLALQYGPDGTRFVARTDNPVQLPAGTTLGDYPTDVDYRYGSGTVQHWSGAAHPGVGSFAYATHEFVTAATVDRSTTDYEHRTFTVSGTTRVDDPRDGSTSVPPAGTTVEIDGSTADANQTTHPITVTGTTEADGQFHVDVTPGGTFYQATARLVSSAPDPRDGDPIVVPEVDATPARTRLLAAPGSARVHTGAAFTISGTAQRLTVDGWVPLVGEAVATTDGVRTNGSGPTDTAGHFGYPVRVTASTYVTTQVVATPYLNAPTSVPTSVAVPTPGALSAVRLTLDPYGTVAGQGTLHGRCYGETLSLEYSPDGHTGWRRLASSAAAQSNSPCSFQVQAGGYVNGFYRITHAESDAMLALVSPVAHLVRVPTRVVSLRLTPGRPARNGTLTATGQLQQLVGRSWGGLARGVLVLVWRPAGDTQFYRVATGHTGSTGRFSVRGKVYGTGGWALVYQPDARHFYTETAVLNVKTR